MLRSGVATRCLQSKVSRLMRFYQKTRQIGKVDQARTSVMPILRMVERSKVRIPPTQKSNNSSGEQGPVSSLISLVARERSTQPRFQRSVKHGRRNYLSPRFAIHWLETCRVTPSDPSPTPGDFAHRRHAQRLVGRLCWAQYVAGVNESFQRQNRQRNEDFRDA